MTGVIGRSSLHQPRCISGLLQSSSGNAFYHYLCSAITPSVSLWTITFAASIIVRDQISTAEEHLGHDTMHAPVSQYVASHWYAADTAGRCRPFPSALSASISGAGSRKPLSA